MAIEITEENKKKFDRRVLIVTVTSVILSAVLMVASLITGEHLLALLALPTVVFPLPILMVSLTLNKSIASGETVVIPTLDTHADNPIDQGF